jgi:hypothetical protein
MNNVNLAKHQLLANHQRLYRAIRHARRQKNRQTISQTSQAIQTSHETRDTDPSHPAKVCRQKRNAQTGTRVMTHHPRTTPEAVLNLRHLVANHNEEDYNTSVSSTKPYAEPHRPRMSSPLAAPMRSPHSHPQSRPLRVTTFS